MLKENEPAPYDGVLVPESAFREIMIDAFSKDELSEQLLKCGKEKDQLLDNDRANRTMFNFITGLGLGLIGGFLLSMPRH